MKEATGRRNARWLWAAALVAGLFLPVEGKTPFHFNLFANYSRWWLAANAASLWNPGNWLRLDENDARFFLNPEGRFSLGSLRGTLSPYLTIDEKGKADVDLREAKTTLSLGRWEVTAGKVLMKLGTGYMFTPISVITPAKALADPEDSLRGQEGVSMVKADFYRADWSLSAILFKKNNWRNAALFGYTSWKGVDVYGILYYPEYRKIEAGLALAATVGQGTEIHAEAMFRRRSPFLVHRVYGAEDPRTTYGEWPLSAPRDRVYPEILLGANLTVGATSLIAEYHHRDWGLSKGDWKKLKSHFLYNFQNENDPFRSPDIRADMQILQTSGLGLMRDYLFARIARHLSKTDLSGLVFVNLTDFSLMSLVEVNVELADGVALFIRPVFFSGKSGSEFAASFYSSMIQIGFTAVL